MTTFAGVIGHPVSHSLSPVMHNAAYQHLGLDWEYNAIDIEPGDVTERVNELFQTGYKGLNVTMPHKDIAYEISIPHGAASRMKTVNTLIIDSDGELHGYSTDGEGFVASLESENISLSGQRVLVIGAGGAARAICDALIYREADIFVTSRKIDQSIELIDAVLASTHEGDARGSIDVVDYSDRDSYASECSILINTTPVGMTIEGKADDSVPIDVTQFSSDQIVVDTIYHPLETELLRQARLRGCTTINGLGMLIHQGALAFKLMTGEVAPIDVMTQAITNQLTKELL